MDLPTVHNCLRLNDENELLLRKLKKMRLKNEQLETELAQIQEQLRLQQLMRDYITSRDAQVQTESQLFYRKGGIKEPKGANENESGKLLQMYNNLQKCFDNEIKRNQAQSETISSLNVKIHELEFQLQGANQKMQQLECKVCKRSQMISKDLLLVIENLKKEKEKLYKERRILKNELAGLDKEFFDEIEDLKFALQESVKLNNQYEKCLKQISTMFGLPFATLSKALPLS